MEDKVYIIPSPIIDKKEEKLLVELEKRYERLTKEKPIVTKTKNVVSNLAEKGKDTFDKVAYISETAYNKIPEKIRNSISDLCSGINASELLKMVLEKATDGFTEIEKQVSKYTLSENDIISKVDAIEKNNDIESLDEICLVRGYDISKYSNKIQGRNKLISAVNGAASGALLLPGVIVGLLTSTLLIFRTVQSIAMPYGFDVKNNPAEMIIAGDVTKNALNPSTVDSEGISGTIAKIMETNVALGIKTAAKEGWLAMAEEGGIPLLIAQVRALAHGAAEKAVLKAGEKTLEENIFKGILKEIGKKLTLSTVKSSVVIVSAIVTSLIDVSQINKVIEYADIFYCKRFLLEKEDNIKLLTNDIVTTEFTEIK